MRKLLLLLNAIAHRGTPWVEHHAPSRVEKGLTQNTDTEPLLGITALESLGIEVDPLNQRLKKLPAVRLKSLRTRSRTEQ